VNNLTNEKGSQFPKKTGKILERDLRPFFNKENIPLGQCADTAARAGGRGHLLIIKI